VIHAEVSGNKIEMQVANFLVDMAVKTGKDEIRRKWENYFASIICNERFNATSMKTREEKKVKRRICKDASKLASSDDLLRMETVQKESKASMIETLQTALLNKSDELAKKEMDQQQKQLDALLSIKDLLQNQSSMIKSQSSMIQSQGMMLSKLTMFSGAQTFMNFDDSSRGYPNNTFYGNANTNNHITPSSGNFSTDNLRLTYPSSEHDFTSKVLFH